MCDLFYFISKYSFNLLTMILYGFRACTVLWCPLPPSPGAEEKMGSWVGTGQLQQRNWTGGNGLWYLVPFRSNSYYFLSVFGYRYLVNNKKLLCSLRPWDRPLVGFDFVKHMSSLATRRQPPPARNDLLGFPCQQCWPPEVVSTSLTWPASLTLPIFLCAPK